MEPELLFFEAPDAREIGHTYHIACWQWGKPGAKPTLLCAHGLTRNGRDFDFVAEALAERFHILAPDMRGRGKSQWLTEAEGYNNPAYLSDIAFILQSLEVKELHWLGTSMGGIMGLMAVNTAPGLVRSLILNDIGCLIPAAGLARIRDLAGSCPAHFATREEAQAAIRLRCATFGVDDEGHWQHLFAHGVEKADEGWRFTFDPAIFNAFNTGNPLEDISLWPLWEAAKAVPVLLLRGAESDLLSDDTAQAMQQDHPNLTYISFAGVGHAPALMSPKHIAPIRDWMSATVKA